MLLFRKTWIPHQLYFIIALTVFIYDTPKLFAQIALGYEPLDARSYSVFEDWEARGLIPTMPAVAPYRRSDMYDALQILKTKDSLLTETDKHWIDILEQRWNPTYKPREKKWKKVHFNLNWEQGVNIFDKFNNVYTILPVLDFGHGSENGNSMPTQQLGAEMQFRFFGKFGFEYRSTTDWMESQYYQVWRNYSPYYGLRENPNEPVVNRKYMSFPNDIFNFQLNYKWISFSVGKNSFKVGEGENGNVIFSDKATPFVNVRMDVQPTKWLHFTYFHGTLVSLITNNATYPTNDTSVLKHSAEYRSKYVVYHSLTLQPWKNIQLTIAESVVYSDKLQFFYFIPFLPYRVFVNDELATIGFDKIDNPNSQLSFVFSMKNILPRSSIYAEMLVDEINGFDNLFNAKRRNQWAFTLGIRLHNYLIKQSSLTLEYTRINPFVYRNINPAQTFENSNVVMGHWLRDDADIAYASFKKQFGWQWNINLWYKYARKGNSGTMQDQYNQGFVYPFDFLEKGVRNYFNEAGIGLSYHLKHSIHFYSEYLFRSLTGADDIGDIHTFRLGCRIGLL